MLTEEKYEVILNYIKEIVNSRYRLLIYIEDNLLDNFSIRKIVDFYSSLKNSFNLVTMYNEINDPIYLKLIEQLNGVNYISYPYSETNKLLGSTYDALILDATRQLRPNDLGVLIEIVKGGGLILFVGPAIDNINNWNTKFHESIKDGEVLKIFEKRLLLKLQNHVNIIYIDSKKFTKGNIEKEILQASVNEKIGEKYPKEIYSLCLTNDQIKVIKAFE
jgi:Predicted P-loop ATPase fused to an acetyltransferase